MLEKMDLNTREEETMSFQKYLLHLLDGTVIDVGEEYDLPAEKGLIGKFRKADPNEILVIGDRFVGFAYVPKRSIVYISTGDVKAGEH